MLLLEFIYFELKKLFIKAQKHSKDIDKIAHMTSVFQPSFYEATRILFEHKKRPYSIIESLPHQTLTSIHDSTTTHALTILIISIECGSYVAVYSSKIS